MGILIVATVLVAFYYRLVNASLRRRAALAAAHK
jgi:hypothetical protein